MKEIPNECQPDRSRSDPTVCRISSPLHLAGRRYRDGYSCRSSDAAPSIRGSAIRIRDRIADLHVGSSTLHGGVLLADRGRRPAVDPRSETGINRGTIRRRCASSVALGTAYSPDVVYRCSCVCDQIGCGMAIYRGSSSGRPKRFLHRESWRSSKAFGSDLDFVRPIRLLAHVRLDSPVVVGWLRPVVLLPVSLISGFTTEQLRAILAHELAHIRRHDFVVNILQRCVESILFYHPAVWWLSKRIRAEREHCCDDIAIRLCGSRKIYAEALIEMERARQPRPILAVAAADGAVLQRFRRVLGMSTSVVDWQSAVGTLLFLGVWIVVGMWQSAGTLQATPAVAAQPVIAAAAIVPIVTAPAAAESVSAIAAILTAQPVAEPEPASSGHRADQYREGLDSRCGHPCRNFRTDSRCACRDRQCAVRSGRTGDASQVLGGARRDDESAGTRPIRRKVFPDPHGQHRRQGALRIASGKPDGDRAIPRDEFRAIQRHGRRQRPFHNQGCGARAIHARSRTAGILRYSGTPGDRKRRSWETRQCFRSAAGWRNNYRASEKRRRQVSAERQRDGVPDHVLERQNHSAGTVFPGHRRPRRVPHVLAASGGLRCSCGSSVLSLVQSGQCAGDRRSREAVRRLKVPCRHRNSCGPFIRGR